jgi:hypothetical protein
MGELILTPNVRRLFISKVAISAVPPGGGFKTAIDFLANKDKMRQTFSEAKEWTKEAIRMVREAAEPNPYKTATDEEIAAIIMERIDKLQADKRKA